jgi:HK97 family phage prohead protease
MTQTTGAGLNDIFERSWTLDDICITRSGQGGDGRTVEAYAAVFDVPAEIKDQFGHYMEVIHRTAFNRTLSHGIGRIGVFYNHAMTMHGTPAEGAGSVPIGSPLSIRVDGRGLRTVTRYNRGELADHVLAAISNGDIKAYSFRGRTIQSNPKRVPRSRNGQLPTVTRTELGLSEYGPTPAPAYVDASIVAVRSQLEALRLQLERFEHSSSTRDDSDDENVTPETGLDSEDSHGVHSARQLARRIAVARLTRGLPK